MRWSVVRIVFLFLFLVFLDVATEIVNDYRKEVQRLEVQVMALQSHAQELEDRRVQQEAVHRSQLMAIVEAVYLRDVRSIGGYETEEDASIDTLYQGILGSLEDYSGLLERVDLYFAARDRYMAMVPLVWPVEKNEKLYISSRFGYRISPVTGRWSFHPAIDIAGPLGTPIIAPADGVVIDHYPAPNGYYRGDDSLGGYIKIEHGSGYVTRYGHLSSSEVHIGDVVSRGDVIGYMGSTGLSTGPHLHYEIIKDGKYVNPAKLLVP